MKDFTAETTSPELPSPAQQLVKIIGNLCFSFFVVSVLVFSVVAVTYQPPDPWFQSSKSITKSLSATLPNSTFATDDSLLPTGEDLVSSPPSFSSAALPLFDNFTSTSCNPNAPLNCSDRAVLSAIQRFNSKIFRKSIIFISYDTPVKGSNPDECDAAWRFRNRAEKSWRRYRDYRRFSLTPNENCSFEVVRAGKFRSGINAGHRPRRAASPPAVQIADPDINDTIPTVGSESEFRKRRYLYYSRGGDYCKSMNHYLWSFLCGLGEAKFLNRTFVMDLSMCLAGTYTSSGENEDGKDFRFYYDFEHLKESASVVEEVDFFRDWRKWDRSNGKTQKGNNGRISVRKVATYKIAPMQLKKEKSTIVWRQFEGHEPENYWYRVCEGRAAKYIQRPWHAIWKSKRLMNIVSEIAGKMDWDYDALHVVRGEKARNKELWPNLDSDTSPESLVEKVTKLVSRWRNLYIATNEPFYNYFDKLRSHYNVHLLEDYHEMWSNKSEWYNETMILNGGRPVQFDGYMRVAVDTEVLYRAKMRVETFNNLTRDCKDGVNAC